MRRKEEFTIYPRSSKKFGKLYWWRTYDSEGKRTSGKSTHQTSKTAARTYVINLLKKGPLLTKGEINFGGFAANWFDWDKCAYVKERRIKGGISRTYVEAQRSYLSNHILPYFKDMNLSSIKRESVKKWYLGLMEKDSARGGKISTATANHCLRTLKLILGEAVEQEYLIRNPAQGVSRAKKKKVSRKVYTEEEARKLLCPENLHEIWEDNSQLYMANLVAGLTGMRLGEIRALQVQDVREKEINVEHAWERKYGMKSTKTNKSRKVCICATLQKQLAEYVRSRDLTVSSDLIFCDDDKTKPAYENRFNQSLYAAQKRIGINDAERKARHLSFHAWRHFFNTYFRQFVPDWKLRLLTGHSDQSMTDHYTDPDAVSFDDVRSEQEKLLRKPS
jgi:integrase